MTTLWPSGEESPVDINNVAEGLPAEMRLPSFKARSTPVAIGEVETVAGGRAP
ncbi:hypothetical protein NKJ95_24110 [Mesorhizobium sp. M0012]|uniref:hypothetical protein n=1 Tax=Mesorhizobium sp. M0012 TaxID=2956840 RepID=UPI00333A3CD6